MEVLKAKQVTRTYGAGNTLFTVLKGIDLTIDKGQSVTIIGKSGSSKSTLMHILALLDRPTSGQVLLAQQDTAKLTNKELNSLRNKTFGFVFQ